MIMLKDEMILPLHRRFKSGTEWEPVGFFSNGLCCANKFDLMLGFFSSTAINVLSDGFASFLYHGGQMRMIINDFLSQEDKNAIMVGEDDLALPDIDIKNIGAIRDTLSQRDKHFFECLAWLIRNDKIEIKVVSPKYDSGISHTKTGVFSDGKNKIAFEGSCNFSRTALIDNIESFTVSCDWDGDVSMANIHEIERDFEETFGGKNTSVDYLPVEEIKTRITDAFDNKDIVELLKDERRIIGEQNENTESASIKKALSFARKKVAQDIEKSNDVYYRSFNDGKPHFPYSSGPRDYQQHAFENWLNNGQKGLFAMATGTGKTITALNCLLEIYKRKGYYKSIILVPTATLVDQWEEECLKFSFSNVIKVYSKNPTWTEEVDRLVFNEKYDSESKGNMSFIIIATYTSFCRERTFNMLNQFDRRRTLLIADECHNMGSTRMLKRMKEICYGRRIGLSATPERQFDDKGNHAIRKFFNVTDKNYTFEYSMKKGIENGVLCKYLYFPHLVRLNATEMAEYEDLSLKIAKYFNYETCGFKDDDEILKMLLLKRKRIIHKAIGKLEIFKRIISDRFKDKGNLKYTLIYVPEGNKPDYMPDEDDFDVSDVIDDDAEADHLINLYTRAVCDLDQSITVRKFISGQKDRDEILEDFANGKIQVLTSMKCLDEGIDVPRSEMAIFCSSTGNPRQFIQRRGRVLRQHKDKKIAIIHDLVVAPMIGETSASYRMEQSLVRNELLRVNNFASLSENPSFSEMELREVIDHYGLSLENNNQNYDNK